MLSIREKNAGEQYDELLAIVVKSDRQTLIEELRAEEIDPQGKAQELIDELNNAFFASDESDDCGHEFVGSLTDELVEVHEAFMKRLTRFSEQYAASFASDDFLSAMDSEDRYEPERESEYSPRTFYRDVRGQSDPIFIISGEIQLAEKREEWRRTTKFDERPIRMLVEYGNFDIGVTDSVHKWMLRVSTRVRRINGEPVPFLQIGGVGINMDTHIAECGVYGCKWRRQITYSDPTGAGSGHGYEASDKEWMEYVVLSIFAHLGSHNQNARNPFPRLIAKRFRDTDDERQSRYMAL